MYKAIRKILPALCSLPLLAGCVHEMDVEQGNLINARKVASLHPGMTRQAVTNLMGEPVLAEPLGRHRLDYVYTYKPGRGQKTEKTLTLTFVNNRLVNIGGNMYSHVMLR